ncbi:MAG: hypothetical protein R3F11_07330 [Verrucomicrobiales bacterium]
MSRSLALALSFCFASAAAFALPAAGQVDADAGAGANAGAGASVEAGPAAGADPRIDQAAPGADAPPPSPEQIQAAIDRGVAFLVADQNKDGSWGTPTQTKGLNIYAPVPGAHGAFRAAITAMCIHALIETGAPDRDETAAAALRRAEDWLLDNLGDVRRADATAIYNVWAHGYSLGALAAMHQRTPESESERRSRIAELIAVQYDRLTRYEAVAGGWGYYDFDVGAQRPAASSISFTTAAVLVGMADARDAGFPPPEDLVKRAADSIRRQQKGDFTYLYGEYLKMQPMRGINRAGGSLGRSHACNAALEMWGDPKITPEVHAECLRRLFDRNGWLSIGRKRPVPHESWFQVAGYFYFFGHYYAARCIDLMPEDQRPPHQGRLAALIAALQEKDGSWWDYPFYNYHRQYGTAFALMTLVRCR